MTDNHFNSTKKDKSELSNVTILKKRQLWRSIDKNKLNGLQFTIIHRYNIRYTEGVKKRNNIISG